MSKVKQRAPKDDLDCDANLTIHNREWAIQRFSWIVLLAFLCAGGLGFFGNGPMSHATAQGKTLTVKYERYARHASHHDVQVTWEQKADAGETARITLDHEYLESLQVDHVIPEPEHVYTAGDRTVFELNLDPTTTRHNVKFDVQALDLGSHETWIRLGNTDSVRISHFIYP